MPSPEGNSAACGSGVWDSTYMLLINNTGIIYLKHILFLRGWAQSEALRREMSTNHTKKPCSLEAYILGDGSWLGDGVVERG